MTTHSTPRARNNRRFGAFMRADSNRGRTYVRALLWLTAVISVIAAPLAAQHDCVPYTPTAAGATVNSDWATPGEQDDYQIMIPNDPGGGYVIASITSEAPSQPMMRIIPPSGVGVVTDVGTTDPGPSPHTLTVTFEVDGETPFGNTYDVEIIEDVIAPINDHPVSYTWTWTFFSQVDCYEPNDGDPSDWPAPTFDAREIPLDQELAAYSIAGHHTFGIGGGDDHNYDWYEFTLDAPTNLWFAATNVPDEQRFRLRLWSETGSAQFSGTSSSDGGEFSFGPELVAAGTWYLEVLPFDRGREDARLSEGESIPDHFVTPYRFVVSTQEIPTCGFMAIFCDGFESGDTTVWSASNP